ncbi:hypothetical protein [Lentzea albidocapillata]|nr:hypothetical protein [Lentzea albidocapillata]
MKLKFWQRCAVAMVGVAVLGTASPASAITSETTGARAYGGSNGDWSVQDVGCDAMPVYGRFTEKGVPGFQRMDNKSGCGTEEQGNIGNTITTVQACRDVPVGRDNCGGWNEW